MIFCTNIPTFASKPSNKPGSQVRVEIWTLGPTKKWTLMITHEHHFFILEVFSSIKDGNVCKKLEPGMTKLRTFQVPKKEIKNFPKIISPDKKKII